MNSLEQLEKEIRELKEKYDKIEKLRKAAIEYILKITTSYVLKNKTTAFLIYNGFIFISSEEVEKLAYNMSRINTINCEYSSKKYLPFLSQEEKTFDYWLDKFFKESDFIFAHTNYDSYSNGYFCRMS